MERRDVVLAHWMEFLGADLRSFGYGSPNELSSIPYEKRANDTSESQQNMAPAPADRYLLPKAPRSEHAPICLV